MLDIKKLTDSCSKYIDVEDISVLEEDIKKLANRVKEGPYNGFFIIVPKKCLTPLCSHMLTGVASDYKMKGIFDMGRLYGMDKGEYTLVHVVDPKDKANKKSAFKIGIFRYPVYQIKKLRIGEITCLTPENEYREALNSYMKGVESWLNTNNRPKDSRKYYYEFNTINAGNFNEEKCYPRYYSQTAIKTRQFLATTKTVLLSDVAEVLLPREERSSDIVAKRVMTDNLSYPVLIDQLPIGKPTTVKLQKGDIIFPRVAKDKSPLLFDIEPVEDVYAGPFTQVIRCYDIQPEYLFLYINSDVAVNVFESVSVSEITGHVLISDLVKLPIVKPEKNVKSYRHAFQNLFVDNDRRNYTLEEIQHNVSGIDSIEDLFNIELASKIKVHNDLQLRRFLADDLTELKTCYEGKAYKATLILAGSILEAVLIDWLSEIDGVDYFVKEYPVKGKYQAQLIDYINAIKKIKAPEWMEEARKSHEIRDKRNLVHARLCLKEDVEINDKTCRKILKYLVAVLKTRGINQGLEV